jgi:hypothetical protein
LISNQQEGGTLVSAGLDVDVFGNRGLEGTKRCSVVSIYEHLGARTLLIELCRSIASRFKDDVDFQFDWWRFKYLADPEIALEAAQRTAEADLILFSAESAKLPAYVQMWFDEWVPNRGVKEGALVLVQSSSARSPSPSLPAFLRLTARRGHLDYFRLNSTLTPPKNSHGTASHSYIQDLLTDNDRPMHWGINE